MSSFYILAMGAVPYSSSKQKGGIVYSVSINSTKETLHTKISPVISDTIQSLHPNHTSYNRFLKLKVDRLTVGIFLQNKA